MINQNVFDNSLQLLCALVLQLECNSWILSNESLSSICNVEDKNNLFTVLVCPGIPLFIVKQVKKYLITQNI